MIALPVGAVLRAGDVMRIGDKGGRAPICSKGCICGYGVGGVVDEEGRWYRP